MASTRDFKAPVIFAENADTVIPPTPTQGQSYRDIANTTEQLIKDGMKYNTIADSATLFNQFQYLLTRFTQEIEQTGILGWSDLVDYKIHARCIGSNGIEYRALVASGPNQGGATDPISSSVQWQEVRPQLAIGETLFLAVDDTPNELGYLGGWVEQEPNISLLSASSGDVNIGAITGSNLQSVPLLEHTHGANLSGLTTTEEGEHDHTQTASGRDNGDDGFDGNYTSSCNNPISQRNTPYKTASSGAHTHGVTGNITIDSEGITNPSIDTRGRGLVGVLWLRSS